MRIPDEGIIVLVSFTEQAAIEAAHNLVHDITIILIAYRRSRVNTSDNIFSLGKGEMKAQVFYELRHASDRFQAMASMRQSGFSSELKK